MTYGIIETNSSSSIRSKELTEHLTQNQIIGYSRCTLTPSELLTSSDHLGDCSFCRELVERALGSDAAYLTLKSEVFSDSIGADVSQIDIAHLTFEQTANYVDGLVAVKELSDVKAHLMICEQCIVAVNDLLSFKDTLYTEPEKKNRRLASLIAIKSFLRQSTNAIASLFNKSPALVFRSTLTVLLLIITGLMIWRMLPVKKKTNDITQTSPSQIKPTMTPFSPATPTQKGLEGVLLAKLNDGDGQIELAHNGKLSGAEYLPSNYQQMIKKALIDQQLEKSSLLTGLGRSGGGRPVIRGSEIGDLDFFAIEPVGKVIIIDHPSFRWSPLAGATSFVVEIYDKNFALVATSPKISGSGWKVRQALRRGDLYSWQVKAVKDEKEFITPRAPAPQAKFFILDQTRANEIVKIRQKYPTSHLALALLYAKSGLLNEAELELRLLHKNNPKSVVVNRLLSSLR